MATKRAVHITVRFRYPDKENGAMNGDETETTRTYAVERLAIYYLSRFVFGAWQFGIIGPFSDPDELDTSTESNILLTGQVANSVTVFNHINNWAANFIEHVTANGAFVTPGAKNLSSPSAYSNVEKIGSFPTCTKWNFTDGTDLSEECNFALFFTADGGGDSTYLPTSASNSNTALRYLSSWLRRSVAVLTSEQYAQFVEAWKKCIIKSATTEIGTLNPDALWWNDSIEFETNT